VATLVSRVSLSLRGFTGSSGSGPYRHTEETPSSGKDEYVDTAACATSTAGVLLSSPVGALLRKLHYELRIKVPCRVESPMASMILLLSRASTKTTNRRTTLCCKTNYSSTPTRTIVVERGAT
jgi:hypothetical protein